MLQSSTTHRCVNHRAINGGCRAQSPEEVGSRGLGTGRLVINGGCRAQSPHPDEVGSSNYGNPAIHTVRASATATRSSMTVQNQSTSVFEMESLGSDNNLRCLW